LGEFVERKKYFEAARKPGNGTKNRKGETRNLMRKAGNQEMEPRTRRGNQEI
jgi:hypothetical protein